MEWLFGRRMTPDEMLRKNQVGILKGHFTKFEQKWSLYENDTFQRALNKAMRELDRERAKMEQQEKKIIMDIKKMAKQGQMDAVKVMAKVWPNISFSLMVSNF